MHNHIQTHFSFLLYFPQVFSLVTLQPIAYFLPTYHVTRQPICEQLQDGSMLRKVSSPTVGFVPTVGSDQCGTLTVSDPVELTHTSTHTHNTPPHHMQHKYNQNTIVHTTPKRTQ